MLFSGQSDGTFDTSETGPLEPWSMHTDAGTDCHDIYWNIAFERICAMDEHSRGGVSGSLQSFVDCRVWMTVNLYEINCFTTSCWCSDCRYLFTVIQSKLRSVKSSLLAHPLQDVACGSEHKILNFSLYHDWLTQVAFYCRSILAWLGKSEVGLHLSLTDLNECLLWFERGSTRKEQAITVHLYADCSSIC